MDHDVTPKGGHGGRWDLAGGVLSALCAIHCLALPILLPFAATFIHAPWLEILLMMAAILIGGYALRHGYSRHGFRLPACLFGLGMASIIFGNWVLTGGIPLASHSAEKHELSPISILFVAAGGLAIISAHILNFILERRWIKSCQS